MKKLLLLLALVFLTLSLSYFVFAQGCVCAGHACETGSSEYGGNCGNCGTLRRDCSSCTWGSWYCWNEGNCTPGSTQCLGTQYQTCSISCEWVNNGTDADADGTDLECGDSLCDAVFEYVDATRLSTERGSCAAGFGYACSTCSDGINNDCDSDGVDYTDSTSNPFECCSDTQRSCKQYSISELTTLRDKPVVRKKNVFTLSQITNALSGGSNLYACTSSAADTVCCSDPNSCVYNGVCYPDSHRQDLDSDGQNEVCQAQSPGIWIDDFEFDCSDSIDNDLDGVTDCADSDCNGLLYGVATNEENSIVEGARVELRDENLGLLQTVFTNSTGGYSMEAACDSGNILSIKADNYIVRTIADITIPAQEEVLQDATLFAADVCESDCTMASDSSIHASCAGVNGCTFFNVQAATVCDNAQPGWIREYNETHFIECADGTPQLNTIAQANVTCSEENLIRRSRLVSYQGKLVRLVVVTCG